MFFKKKLAFTLAEVLITLGIIGIVAQATIPTLMVGADKKKLGVQNQKFVSEFDAGFKRILLNTGCETMQCTGIYALTGQDFVDNYTQELKAVFKDVDVCTSSCEYDFLTEKTISGHDLTGWGYTRGTIVDPLYRIGESFVRVYSVPYLNNASTGRTKWLAHFFVDINGHDKPNTYGKDIHWIHVSDYGAFFPDYGKDYCETLYNVPYTSCSDYWKVNGTCDTTGGFSIGDGCMARIMENSWQFDFW